MCRFVIEGIAPGGGAEEEGTLCVGDVIKGVDGECVCDRCPRVCVCVRACVRACLCEAGVWT